MKVFDLAFGNSVAVREALLSTYMPVPIGRSNLLKYDYPPYAGLVELTELTKQVIKRQTGQDYKHVILTNGATGAISIVLGHYKSDGVTICITRNAPYYTKYPRMVSHNNLDHLTLKQWKKYGEGQMGSSLAVALIDYPSNPLGEVTGLDIDSFVKTVIDGVYLSKVYMNNPTLNIRHNVLVGSYSKLLGINGIRLGWIATNDDVLYRDLKDRTEVEYCGLSMASQEIVIDIVKNMDWEAFETRAKMQLDYNREEWSKLEKYFGDTPVNDIGMFYYAPFDDSCKKLLEKAGVKWTSGSAMDVGDAFGRINLGQNNDLTKEAVDLILKLDRIK